MRASATEHDIRPERATELQSDAEEEASSPGPREGDESLDAQVGFTS